MTRKEEQAIRKHRRTLKRADIEQRRAERVEKRKKRELAKRYSEEIIHQNGVTPKLPVAPFCYICNTRLWCVHNLKRHINKEA